MSFPRVCVAAAMLTGVVLCEASLAQQVVQLPLPYNADVVREVGGTISGGGIDPAQLDPGGRGLVTQSEAAANDAADPRGLPDDGMLALPSGAIQLGPYNGNNAVRLASFGTSADNLAFGAQQLAGFDYLDLYLTGAAGQLFARHQRSAFPFSAITSFFADWEEETLGEIVLNDLDRTGTAGAGFEDVDDVAIFRWRIGVRDPALVSVSITLDPTTPVGQGKGYAILAATATRVPEPSGAILALSGLCLLLRRR